MANLTKRQKEIIDFISDYRREHGISPVQREICERFGYSSFGTLQKHIKLLLEKGVLVREWNKRRALTVASQEGDASAVGAVALPLAGLIAAGQPIDVTPGDEPVYVPEQLTRRGDNYVLKVRGDSMIEDGIRDGDLVVVHRQERAENGETVVALVRGEATLKRFFRDPSQAGSIRLQPANARMGPIVAPEADVQIQGVVVGLMRRY